VIDIEVLARELDEAVLGRREIEPLTKRHGPFDLKTAYAIQRAGLGLRAQRGERVVGYKLGFSSEAKRHQMDLATPIYGYLTDAMSVQERLVLAEGIHPRVEPEIAFVTASELRGDVTFEEALRACAAVAPALEILDSRFVGFKYFSVPDVIADDCSSWRFALGKQQGLCEVGDLLIRMSIDGRVVQEARSSAISAHPVLSLVQLCAMLATHGQSLPAGSIVLTGGATAAEALKPGMRVSLEIESIGQLMLSVEEFICGRRTAGPRAAPAGGAALPRAAAARPWSAPRA
jgi:2-oxo-3-hexenedioate decarboxylase